MIVKRQFTCRHVHSKMPEFFSNSIFLTIFIHGSYKKEKKNTNETNTIEFILHRKLYEIGEKNVGMKNIKKLFFHKNNNIKKSKKKKD